MTTSLRDAASDFVSAPAQEQPGGPAGLFRREFACGPGLLRARLYLTALGIVDLTLNGRPVSGSVLVPGWTAYRDRLAYETHDVTHLAREGLNVLGATVGEGWAVGRIGFTGQRHHWSDRPALLVRLELEYPDHLEVIGTDERWCTSTGGVLRHGLYEGETFDARVEPLGWRTPGFDDSAWSAAQLCAPDVTDLVETTWPTIQRIQTLSPVATTQATSGRLVVDFGQVVSGWVRVRVTGSPGDVVTLRHCELLVAGEPEYESNRGAEATDRYVLRGGAEEVWEPRFTFHGFRYVEVDAPVEVALEAVVVHTALERTGWFGASHPGVEKLHENVVWSFRGNAVGVPTDCPQRDERLGWTGDINAFAPVGAFLYDVTDWLGSWLEDLAAEQRRLGVVPYVVPHVEVPPKAPAALWADAAVNVPWALYQESGEKSVLRKQWPSMMRHVESVLPFLDDRGLWSRGFQFGDWVDPDAPPQAPFLAKTHPAQVATAHFVRSLAQLAATAVVLEEDPGPYLQLHSRVRDAFRQEWVTSGGRLVGETATGYALAICFGLLDEPQLPRAGLRLAQIVADGGYRIATGFAGTPWVMHALSSTGHVDAAYRLLLREECPSFLYPVSMGATTVWERWDAVLPDGTLNSTGMTSLNHYALGAVADWLHRVVGGLSPTRPGYASVRIAPEPGSALQHAGVRKRTRYGDIDVRWRKESGWLHLDATVPHGVQATICLPYSREEVHLNEGGAGAWEVAMPPPAEYTLATPFHVLQGDPAVWPAVVGLLAATGPGGSGLLTHMTQTWPTPEDALRDLPVGQGALREAMAKVVSGSPTW